MARLSSTDELRIATNRSSSLDKAPQLVGRLNSDGIASLEADSAYVLPSRSDPPRSLKLALDAAVEAGRSSSTDTASETASEEDYDALKHDPMVVVVGGKGGGFVADSDGKITPESSSEKAYEELEVPKLKRRSGPARLKSIPVTLNKLKEKGRYVLTADDDALREILRMGIERVLDTMKSSRALLIHCR
jgi:sterol O-acyltransferase